MSDSRGQEEAGRQAGRDCVCVVDIVFAGWVMGKNGVIWGGREACMCGGGVVWCGVCVLVWQGDVAAFVHTGSKRRALCHV